MHYGILHILDLILHDDILYPLTYLDNIGSGEEILHIIFTYLYLWRNPRRDPALWRALPLSWHWAATCIYYCTLSERCVQCFFQLIHI